MKPSIQRGAFIPVVGKCYELHFGKIRYKGIEGFVQARVRINGIPHSQWIDLDTNQALDPVLAAYAVQAHQEIDCP